MKLGIIGAMDIEVALLRELMDVTDTHTEAGMEFCEGKLEGLDAVVVKCGVGKVAAAACAQILATRFGVAYIVNTGIAGALHPDLRIGDAVVATECAYFDVNVKHYDYALGQVPGMPPTFKTDEELRHALLTAANDNADVVYEGLVLTGDQFIGVEGERDQISAGFDEPLCCEMEGAAIGQVAYMNGIPFAVLRVISDLADGTTSDDIDVMAANLAARIVGDFACFIS